MKTVSSYTRKDGTHVVSHKRNGIKVDHVIYGRGVIKEDAMTSGSRMVEFHKNGKTRMVGISALTKVK